VLHARRSSIAAAVCVLALALFAGCTDDSDSSASLCETVEKASDDPLFADRSGPSDPTTTNRELIHLLGAYAEFFRAIRPYASSDLSADIDTVVANIESAAIAMPEDDDPAFTTAFQAALPVTGEAADARARVDAWLVDECSPE
jgi:hypothetical protein